MSLKNDQLIDETYALLASTLEREPMNEEIRARVISIIGNICRSYKTVSISLDIAKSRADALKVELERVTGLGVEVQTIEAEGHER